MKKSEPKLLKNLIFCAHFFPRCQMIMNALLVERESSTASLEVKKIFGLTKKFQKKFFLIF